MKIENSGKGRADITFENVDPYISTENKALLELKKCRRYGSVIGPIMKNIGLAFEYQGNYINKKSVNNKILNDNSIDKKNAVGDFFNRVTKKANNNISKEFFNFLKFSGYDLNQAVPSNDHTDNNSAFYGESPIHLAAKNGCVETLETLLNLGVDIEKKDNEGKTALHFAIENGHTKIVEKLLEKGANVNANYTERNNEKTPFHLITEKNALLVATLKEAGGDYKEYHSAGHSPLYYALANNNPLLAEAFIDCYSNEELKNSTEPFIALALKMDNKEKGAEIAKKLIDKDADINIPIKSISNSDLPWVIALKNEQYDLIKHFIDKESGIPIPGEYTSTVYSIKSLATLLVNKEYDQLRTIIEAAEKDSFDI